MYLLTTSSIVCDTTTERKETYVRINVTLRHVRANIVATEKIEVLYAYSEYVFADLGIQNVMCMHRIIFSSAACLSISQLTTLTQKRQDFFNTFIIIIWHCNPLWVFAFSA